MVRLHIHRLKNGRSHYNKTAKGRLRKGTSIERLSYKSRARRHLLVTTEERMEPTCCLCHSSTDAFAHRGRAQLPGSIQLVKPFEIGYAAYGKLFYDGCYVCRLCLKTGLRSELQNPRRNYIRSWWGASACANCRQLFETHTGITTEKYTVAHFCSSSFRQDGRIYCGYESGQDGSVFAVTALFPEDVRNSIENMGRQPAVICDYCIQEWERLKWIVLWKSYM